MLKNSNFLKKLNCSFFTNFFICLVIYFYVFVYFLKIDFIFFWFNHLKLNNFLLNIFYVIFFINYIVLNTIKFYKNKNINFNIDYFFAIFNLCVFIPIIYISNTMYTFIFLLEVNSILILYKFSVSKYFFNSSKNNEKNKFTKNTPKYYVNMMFFQYWVNFFSSVILFFSLFNILLFFGTTDWFLINIFNKLIFPFSSGSNFFLLLTYFLFIVGMFIKIGFTPSHLFKIEVYKGIPLISILFYTVFYFISFFLFFILIVFYYLNSIKLFVWFFVFIFVVCGLVYILTLIFDINLLKTFFAYSTVINSLTFIIVLLASLN